MKKKFIIFFLMCFFRIIIANPLDLSIRSQTTIHQHYNAMIEHYQNENWKKLVYKSQNLISDFPNTPFALEGLYYLGIGYYKLGEFEYANQAFSKYLKKELSPKFFEQVFHFKFGIAQAFEQGMGTHLFGWKHMPKWLPAHEQALAIYNEIITTLSHDDLAARSLYRKGMLLLNIKEYKTSVEVFRTLIRRFPKHSLAPNSYLGIAHVYLAQSKNEFPDADRLDLAEVNLRKFRDHFPGEPRLVDAENIVLHMKESLAADLFEIAAFYMKTKKPKAATIYYTTIIKKYPGTKIAIQSQKHLEKLNASSPYSQKQHH